MRQIYPSDFKILPCGGLVDVYTFVIRNCTSINVVLDSIIVFLFVLTILDIKGFLKAAT